MNMRKTQIKIDMNCIWVGVDGIESKLCDRNFDCDTCAFHTMLQDRFHRQDDDESKKNILTETCERISAEEYYPGYIYLKNNLYLKKLLGNSYYIGFSPLVSCLLSDVNVTHPDCKGTLINKEDPLLKIEGSWGSFQIASPMDMVCHCKIDSEGEGSSLLNWFGMIEVTDERLRQEAITKKEFTTRKKKILKNLSAYDIGKQDVGVTLYDGANQVRHLSELMGVNAYIRFLVELFSNK